jgi:hypothetical protein
LTATWLIEELTDEDYGLKFEGMFDYEIKVVVRKLDAGDPYYNDVKAKLDAKGENLTMYELYKITFQIEGEGAEPRDITKLLIPFDSAWQDLDILKVFYVSDDLLFNDFLTYYLEDDGYIHVPIQATSYYALAGSMEETPDEDEDVPDDEEGVDDEEELPDTSDPGSMGGWIGLLGLVLLVFSKKKE